MTTTDATPESLRAETLAAMQADAPPVIPPCPSWCVSTAKLHPLEFDREDGVYVRSHEAYCGDLVNVEATERSDGNGGPVTLSEPALLVNGEDYKGEAVTSDKVLALASEMLAAVTVRDRLSAGCPRWCDGDCDRDEVGGGVMHWSSPSPLPAADDADKFDWPQPEILAVIGQETKDHPIEDVTFLVRTSEEHFRSAARTREFAHAILAFVDRVTGTPAPVLDDRGQVADLGGYEPQNR